MKASDYIVDFIAKQKVAHVFEVIGGMTTHLLDSIAKREDMTCVTVHHEQAGAFAAEGYARVNGYLGVTMATSGPGATNLITGIGSAYFDSIPCLYITGQVNTYEYKFDAPVRQIGFQETDVVSIVKPITKYAAMITNANNIRYELEKAVYIAQSGRPGPVLIDIPMNIQRADIEPDKQESFFDSKEYKELSKPLISNLSELDKVVELLNKAQRPLILAGGGIRSGNAANELREFVTKTNIPVVSSLMGLDAIAHNNPTFVGMIGSYGNRYANITLANTDLLIVLGSRLDTRQTGTRPDTFARAAKIVHVDIDTNELNRKIKATIAIKATVKDFLSELNKKITGYDDSKIKSWKEYIANLKNKYPSYAAPANNNEMFTPNYFMHLLSSKLKGDEIIALDVGQHQMWAAQSLEIKGNQRVLISGGMGSMGFALPAGIGAAIMKPDSPIIIIAGDGGFQMNIQELQTIVRNKINIKIFVMNNHSLGMVRQFQTMYFDSRYQSTISGYSCPDFNKISEAYGIKAYSINTTSDIENVLSQALSNNEPAFINVNVDMFTDVEPKLVVNKPIEDLSPLLSREELKENMIIDILDD